MREFLIYIKNRKKY